ncbi:MAG: hypothetical protein OHK0046_19060 [Anaerolineae bacterium]
MHSIPTYRLLLMYDVHPSKYEIYFQYISREFVPALQEMGLHMIFAWHVHGEYPERQVEFICRDKETLRRTLTGERYKSLEDRLRSYTTTFSRKIVRFENRYQF